ncbi:protein far-red impaired response 1-like [Sesbania bispinosa]|nr:protein far-red impaired response 1-like [Sesbania bispinosa]
MSLQVVGVFAVPSSYISRRWTKDIRSKHLKRKMNDNACTKKERYDHLYEKVFQLLEEGSLSNESFNFASHALEETFKRCASINQSLKIDRETVGKNILHEKPLLDPIVSKTKGAPRRIKSGIKKGHKRTSSGKVKKSGFAEKEAKSTPDVLNDELVVASIRMEVPGLMKESYSGHVSPMLQGDNSRAG